ncbi:ribosome maturation factor RimM [Paenibacillus thermoaerophilus]|jgi:16S rRNA processing protein RimM|uniref:Ribosome maturation factor RimM n=1 Tax=Paenibacillus thermoaerophilus TaxID=1215385 RepID=A0ABW2V3G1_9BACL|nr:ribosome maturation factor RimM [Paenibacillus thermoaerophilus]TMV19193.1 ribosome maturation factor RimM [Paenibacillus thermoaerophilus]
MPDPRRRLTVGQVINTHGIRGELKIWPQTDFPDVRFAKGSQLLLVHPEGRAEEPVRVERSRGQKNVYIVKFDAFDNINEVERFKGWAVKVEDEQRVPLQPGEYYFRDIIGCDVLLEDGSSLGVVEDILRPGANDVWVVKRPKGKPALLPVIDEVVLNVDVASRTITVRLMEGLIDD